MHHAFPVFRLSSVAGMERTMSDAIRPLNTGRRRGDLHVHIGLLDGHWSLESGHWSADAIRQLFPSASPSTARNLGLRQSEDMSPERRLLRAAANVARINYHIYESEPPGHLAEPVVDSATLAGVR
jgi:hypothetical protein